MEQEENAIQDQDYQLTNKIVIQTIDFIQAYLKATDDPNLDRLKGNKSLLAWISTVHGL